MLHRNVEARHPLYAKEDFYVLFRTILSQISQLRKTSSKLTRLRGMAGRALLDDVEDPEEFTRHFNHAAGPCIAALCEDRDLTQSDVGALLGITPRHVRRLYGGEVAFTFPQLVLIARKTQTTLNEILDLISHWPGAAPRKPAKSGERR